MLSDSILDQVYKNWDNVQPHRTSTWAVLRNTFGMPADFEANYFDLQPSIKTVIATSIYAPEPLQTLISSSCNLLSDALPDLITFNSSIVDQMPWERVAALSLTSGTSEAECDFFTLVNEFCCSAILAPIAGSQFPESYQLLASDLVDLNRCYYALCLGVPRLSPIKGLPAAKLAKKRLLREFMRLFGELENPRVRRVEEDDGSVSGEEMDADTETPLATLNELFSKHDVSIQARASLGLELVHDIVSEIVPLVFWTLVHIYSSSSTRSSQEQETPLSKTKAETKSWAQATQPPSLHPLFPAPPAITFTSPTQPLNPDSFPYLRSCIAEARRLYTSSCTIHTFTTPTILTVPTLRPSEHEQWSLEANTLIDTGLSCSLINTSPSNYTSPQEFMPDRFLKSAPGPSINPPEHIDPSGTYKTALVVAIVAGILQLWDVRPAPEKSFVQKLLEARDEMHGGVDGSNNTTPTNTKTTDTTTTDSQNVETKEKEEAKWILPPATDARNIKVPSRDVRVRVRRREDLPSSMSKRGTLGRER